MPDTTAPMTIPLRILTPTATHTLRLSPSELSLSDLLRRANLPLNTRCGQRGLCDGCTIDLLEGSLLHAATGRLVSANGSPLTLRACEYTLANRAPLTIRISPRSLLAHQPLVLTDFSINVPHAHHPLHQHIQIPPMPANSLLDTLAERLSTSLPLRLCESAHMQLPALQASRIPHHASIARRADHWLVTHLSPDPLPAPLGAAIDIGTTTVVVLLVDLTDGRILSRAAAFNQQMHLGDDVVTRITLCTSSPDMVRQLQEAVIDRTIVPLLTQAIDEAHASPSQLACLSIAGNTTMLHLFAGTDPSPMGVAPFTPAFLDHRVLPALPRCPLPHSPTSHLLPSASAYIGSDLTAGVIASGLLYDEGPSLLVDVGTNGEIILKHNRRLLGCATAAGPAFEGAGLSSGTRAATGAISRIRLAANPFSIEYDIIGAPSPLRASVPSCLRASPLLGLCGSAYIDFLAEARRIGLLLPAGRFDRVTLLDAQSHLIPLHTTDLALRLACADASHDILISQADIARLLQAKAAIAAGILTLLTHAGLQPADIRRLYLAGGFGTHMSAANAIAIGLLPGFTVDQIRPVGNTALAGAYIALLDSSILDELARIKDQLEVIELNLDPNFEMTYIDQLALP